MINMEAEIKSYLDTLDQFWQPIKEQAIKYSDQENHTGKDGTIQIFRRPWVAPFNYGLIFYPPARQEYFGTFQQKTGKAIPSLYQQMLLQMNGCFVYDFALYGLTPSLYSIGLLDRSLLQPLDLGTANTDWIEEYRVDKTLFHIGGRAYSYEENIGYFLDNSNNILSIRKNGKQLGKWTVFRDFLTEEIAAAERMMLLERKF
jgi:hypothetical protein